MENKNTPYMMSEKWWGNTFYQPHPSSSFYFYNLSDAEKITEECKEACRKMEESLKEKK